MGMIPNGDQGFVDANGHFNGNGHSAALPIENRIVREASALLHHHQNGKSGHSMLETAINQTPSTLNGSEFMLGAGVLDSDLRPHEVEFEPSPHDGQVGAELNGAAGSYVGELSHPTAPSVEQATQSEDLSEAVQVGSQHSAALSEHPACGSLFTPYLVTEIRELRNRSRRRRSWWRRIFG
ncbi:MAG TPA: hypothetical protein VGY55_07325 [Pirellulales bacterium]|nr:hypothetical protein [Pirellulales bacterium]